jgi:hypothetical protein
MDWGKVALAACAAWLAGGASASAQDSSLRGERKSGRIAIGGQISEGQLQDRFDARIFAAFADLPIAFGVAAEKGNGLDRLMLGGAANLSEMIAIDITGQFVREAADNVFGLATDQKVETWSIASSLHLRLNDATTVSLGVDGWNSPSALLVDTPVVRTVFDGARGARISTGIATYIDPTLKFGASVGYESALKNGENGLFAKVDFNKAFGNVSFEGTAWTSPNFGDGAQLGLGYRFKSDMIASVYAGYRNGIAEGGYVGARLSMEFGQSTSTANGELVDRLDRQMQYAQMTMPGVPKTAGTTSFTKVRFPFVTVDGVVCQSAVPTPGCTFFGATNNRITVTVDPNYDISGKGSDDLWYVRFNAFGKAAVYNQLGELQYLVDTDWFAGYIGGNTLE